MPTHHTSRGALYPTGEAVERMREIRCCPVTGRLVVLNEAWNPGETSGGDCILCSWRGQVIHREGDRMVVPHPIPVLGIEGDPRPVNDSGGVRMQGVGAHELLFGGHQQEDHAGLLRLAQRRIADLRGDKRLRGFQVGRRQVDDQHPVWQLFAFPFEQTQSAPANWRDEEMRRGRLILERSSSAVAMMAWAPRVPFECWILPVSGRKSFEASKVEGVAELLGRWLPKIQRALGTSSFDLSVEDGQPWRLEILPRFGQTTLFEQTSRMAVHGVFPEAARDFLLA